MSRLIEDILLQHDDVLDAAVALLNTGMNCPHPQPFSLGEKGALTLNPSP